MCAWKCGIVLWIVDLFIAIESQVNHTEASWNCFFRTLNVESSYMTQVFFTLALSLDWTLDKMVSEVFKQFIDVVVNLVVALLLGLLGNVFHFSVMVYEGLINLYEVEYFFIYFSGNCLSLGVRIVLPLNDLSKVLNY